jgi:uncharacterized protein
MTRDRDEAGRPRNARPRDALGRPLARSAAATPIPDEAALPPAEALRRAQQLLDDGRAFHAHEVLEAVWKATEGPHRGLWRALAQLCVGITHTQRGNAAGAAALFARAADNLTGHEHDRDDVPVAELIRWAREACAGNAGGTPRIVRG